jgi:hypothetical protein
MQYIRPGFLKLVFTASLLLWASIAVPLAMAHLVTFQFTGSVTDVGVGTPTAYSIGNGSVLNGSYLMDPQDPNIIRTVNPAGHATYDAVGVKNLTFTLGDLVASPPFQGYTKAGSVGVSSSSSAGGQSYITSTSFDSPEVASLEIGYFGGSGYINDNLDLPTTPPSITSFTSTRFRLYFNNQSGTPFVEGHLTMAPVPLPPAVILFGAGLVALVGLVAGNWRHKEPRILEPISKSFFDERAASRYGTQP